MKDYKRIISIILSVLMIISVMIVYPASANGAEETQPTRVIKFTDNQGWGEVYAHMWGKNDDLTEWHGTAMELVGQNSFNQNVFSVAVPESAIGIVFNNGNDQQTVDVKLDETSGVAEGYYTNGAKDNKGHFMVFPWDSVPATSNETDATTGPTSDTTISSDTEPQETSLETVETEPAPVYDYYMIGSEALFGAEWKIDSKNLMGKLNNGNYYLTIENAPAGKFYFKVMDKNGVPYPPQGQFDTVTTTGGETVIFGFNPEKGYAIVSTDGILPTYPIETEPTETTNPTTVPTTVVTEPTETSTETEPTETSTETEPTETSTETEPTETSTETKPTESQPSKPTGKPDIKNLKVQDNTPIKKNGSQRQCLSYNKDGKFADFYTFTIKNCKKSDVHWICKDKSLKISEIKKYKNKYKVEFSLKKPTHRKNYKVVCKIKGERKCTINLLSFTFEKLDNVKVKRTNGKTVKINWNKTLNSRGYLVTINDSKGNLLEKEIKNVNKTEYTYSNSKLKAGKEYKASVRLIYKIKNQKAKYYGAPDFVTIGAYEKK